MYDEENPISRSNYTSEAVGNYTITLYNASSKDIEGVTYMITIPATGTMINDYTTEWRPNLYKAIEVKNTEGAIITYDGQSNFNPNAKYIQIRIPTIKVGQLPEILISLQAPKF